MLTDAGLRALKPKEKPYKRADRDGLYAYVTKSGTISFRFNYAINGRQETLVFGLWTRWNQAQRGARAPDGGEGSLGCGTFSRAPEKCHLD